MTIKKTPPDEFPRHNYDCKQKCLRKKQPRVKRETFSIILSCVLKLVFERDRAIRGGVDLARAVAKGCMCYYVSYVHPGTLFAGGIPPARGVPPARPRVFVGRMVRIEAGHVEICVALTQYS